MDTKDKKNALLFEIMKIYDECIRSLILTYKKKNEKIGYKINCKYCGTWIYFIINLLYFICSFFYIFPVIFSKMSFKIFPDISPDNLFIPFLIIVATVIFVLFSCYEETNPKKRIKEETGVINKKTNSYDQFYSDVEIYSSEKLHFIKDYIEHLLSKSKRNNNEKIITLIFIPLMIRVAVNNLSQVGGQCFWLRLIGYLFIGALFVSFYNMLPKTFNLEVLKLIRVKTFIEYVLLCRRTKEIIK